MKGKKKYPILHKLFPHSLKSICLYVLFSQFSPEYPTAHWQLRELLPASVQIPPFRQGFLAHGPAAE